MAIPLHLCDGRLDEAPSPLKTAIRQQVYSGSVPVGLFSSHGMSPKGSCDCGPSRIRTYDQAIMSRLR